MVEDKDIFVDYQGGKMKCQLKDVFGFRTLRTEQTKPQMLVCERLGVEAKIKLPIVAIEIDNMDNGTLSICEYGEPHHNCKDYPINGEKTSGIYYTDDSGVDVKIKNKKYYDNGWI